MKIIATIRTLNEKANIEKCCQAYQFCDKILVADGGSTDNTKDLALQYPKVQVRDYLEKVQCDNGIWRNPDYLHLRFLWDWAIEEGADWIISQDCDQRPNKFLKQDARSIMEEMSEDFLLATQVYLWGNDQYFPGLSRPGHLWMQGLWAWRANINLKVIDKMPHFEFSFDGKKAIDINKQRVHRILPPYCYMHFGWQSEEQTDAHVDYYRKSGLIKGMRHPLEFAGKPQPLEDWMIE